MSESPLVPSREFVYAGLAAMRVDVRSESRQDRIDQLSYLKTVVRQAELDMVELVASLDSGGDFVELGVRPVSAVADLLRCREGEARRMVAVARAVFPTSLGGLALEPRLPATAMALAGWEIDQAHAEVIEHALRKGAAERISPEQWATLEEQLAGLARLYRPDELAGLAARMLERLDQDGPPPDEDEPQVNELHLSAAADGAGGRVKGRLDAVRAVLCPATDELKSLGERQAGALGEICEHALDEGRLPLEGGERPHVTAILDYQWMREQARGLMFDFGGRGTAADLRTLLCDCGVTPVVFDGASQPLDLGRERCCVSLAQRRAVAARDRGCAHPGCHRKPAWCQVHHLVEWVNGGETNVEDLVMLCRTHHRMIHQSGVNPAGKSVCAMAGRNSFRPVGWIRLKRPADNPYPRKSRVSGGVSGRFPTGLSRGFRQRELRFLRVRADISTRALGALDPLRGRAYFRHFAFTPDP
jgi:5-methylcytosine-specific restriction protein A